MKNMAAAKRALQRAFAVQTSGEGFGFVEFLATCPTKLEAFSHQGQ